VAIVAVAMVAVAEGAVWLLRPGETPIAPASVSEDDYFNQTQIERGRSYGDGQALLAVGGLALEGVVIATLAAGRPRSARRALERLNARPVAGAAAAGAGISVLLAVAAVPLGAAAHARAVDYGISVQSLGGWLGDAAKAAGIQALISAGAAAALIALVRRFPRRWWIPGTGVLVTGAVVLTWLAPIVLAPLFSHFDRLGDHSQARQEVVGLGDRAGVDIGDVYRVDASRRGTALNAYVNGLGSTKRVVLYDNLISGTDREELRSVVAHELGHVKHQDVPRGLAFVALVAPLGLLFTRELAGLITSRTGTDPRAPAALPAYLAGLLLAALLLGVVGNQLSRQVEASADTFALRLTHDPHGMIELQRRLTIRNVGDPDPPAALTALFGTHPPTIDRIGSAIAYRHERRRSGSGHTIG